MKIHSLYRLKILLALTAITLGNGCDGGTITGNALQEANVVHGQVLQHDETGTTPVANAKVTISGVPLQTDFEGRWKTVQPIAENGYTLQVFKDGYRSINKRIVSAPSYLQTILQPVHLTQTIDPRKPNAIAFDENHDGAPEATILIPANALPTSEEQVTINMSLARPQVDDEYAKFPGTFEAVRDDESATQDLLRTFGAVDIYFSKDGNLLDLGVMNEKVSIQLAVDETMNPDELSTGTTIPTWWLDEDTGTWIEEGQSRIVSQNGKKYAEWNSEHFTWWNVDYPLNSHACLALKLDYDPANEPYAGIELYMEGVSYSGRSTPLAIKPNEYLVLTGWRNNDVRLYGTYAGADNMQEIMRILPLDSTEGDVEAGTFRLPDSLGSGVRNSGPNGILAPEQDCLVVHRNISDTSLQKGTIEGTVSDDEGNELSNALIYLSPLGVTTYTNPDGHYEFEPVPWTTDFDIDVSVGVLSYKSGTKNLVFQQASITRNQAHQNLNFTGIDTNNTPPSIQDVWFSTLQPAVSEEIAFRIGVADDSQIVTAEFVASDGDLNAALTKIDSTWVLQGTWYPGSQETNVLLTFTFQDPSGKKTVLSRRVQIVDLPPIVNVSGPDIVEFGSLATYSVDAFDPEGQDTTITVTRGKNAIAFDEISNTFVLSGDTEGVQFVDVIATDGPNESAYQFAVLVVDNSPATSPTDATGPTDNTDPVAPAPVTPETILISGPSGTVSEATSWFQFTSDISEATFECYIDTPPFTACGSSPLAVGPLTDGTHSFVIRAVNSTVTDPTPEFRTWTIDSTGPLIYFTTTPATTSTWPIAYFDYAATTPADIAYYECRLDNYPWHQCHPESAVFDLIPSGAHSFELRAVDVFDNWSTTLRYDWTQVVEGSRWRRPNGNNQQNNLSYFPQVTFSSNVTLSIDLPQTYFDAESMLVDADNNIYVFTRTVTDLTINNYLFSWTSTGAAISEFWTTSTFNIREVILAPGKESLATSSNLGVVEFDTGFSVGLSIPTPNLPRRFTYGRDGSLYFTAGPILGGNTIYKMDSTSWAITLSTQITSFFKRQTALVVDQEDNLYARSETWADCDVTQFSNTLSEKTYSDPATQYFQKLHLTDLSDQLFTQTSVERAVTDASVSYVYSDAGFIALAALPDGNISSGLEIRDRTGGPQYIYANRGTQETVEHTVSDGFGNTYTALHNTGDSSWRIAANSNTGTEYWSYTLPAGFEVVQLALVEDGLWALLDKKNGDFGLNETRLIKFQ